VQEQELTVPNAGRHSPMKMWSRPCKRVRASCTRFWSAATAGSSTRTYLGLEAVRASQMVPGLSRRSIIGRCLVARSTSRRSASLRRTAARRIDAKGHAVVAVTKICLPSTRSTVSEHLESIPRLGPLRSEIRTITRRIRLANRRSAS